mmetsp:Transcript_17197/g.60415  ORF Transcript_17197/g.60415 Transcript_17197/m.60415 type:complete len:224 (-) Transcript_17197:61-732(-)
MAWISSYTAVTSCAASASCSEASAASAARTAALTPSTKSYAMSPGSFDSQSVIPTALAAASIPSVFSITSRSACKAIAAPAVAESGWSAASFSSAFNRRRHFSRCIDASFTSSVCRAMTSSSASETANANRSTLALTCFMSHVFAGSHSTSTFGFLPSASPTFFVPSSAGAPARTLRCFRLSRRRSASCAFSRSASIAADASAPSSAERASSTADVAVSTNST